MPISPYLWRMLPPSHPKNTRQRSTELVALAKKSGATLAKTEGRYDSGNSLDSIASHKDATFGPLILL